VAVGVAATDADATEADATEAGAADVGATIRLGGTDGGPAESGGDEAKPTMSPRTPTPDEPGVPVFPPEVPPPAWPGRQRPGAPPVPAAPLPTDELRSQVYGQLLGRRTVLLDRALDGETAMFVAAQLMTLDAQGTERVTLIVNSPGGPLEAAVAVLDTIDLTRGPVDTTCLGQAGGTAAVVVAAGTGRRLVGASARLHLRLPEVELVGTATQLGHEATHLRRLHAALVERLAAATGQDGRLVARDVERGRTLGAHEAVTYGLVDGVIDRLTP
jgi:ATP-dependent Clp protease protease subunit